MQRTNWRRAATSAALLVTVASATGCIAVSRSTRATADLPPPPQEVWQEWTCDRDDAFEFAVARAELRRRIEQRAAEGWAFVDFEVGRIRDRTCLIASFTRTAGG